MESTTMRAYNAILHFSVFAFTFAFVWFVFVYYPNIIREFKSGHIPQAHIVPAAVASNITKFPVEMQGYKIEHDYKSPNYYVIIAGGNLVQYVNNKIAAELTLKNVLSADSLCRTNIIFASAGKLSVPSQYSRPSNC